MERDDQGEEEYDRRRRHACQTGRAIAVEISADRHKEEKKSASENDAPAAMEPG